jgi:hypothetical protein
MRISQTIDNRMKEETYRCECAIFLSRRGSERREARFAVFSTSEEWLTTQRALLVIEMRDEIENENYEQM